MTKTFTLPNLGDGITSGVVVQLRLEAGQPVAKGDTVIEVETDKAVLPVPAPEDGTVEELFTAEEEELAVGEKIFSYQAAGSSAVTTEQQAKKEIKEAARQQSRPEENKSEKKTALGSSQAVKFFNLPNLGDGITSGVVVQLRLEAGQLVAKGDTVIEVETDKAVLPVPAPEDGTVEELFTAEEEELAVGEKIFSYQAAGSSAVTTEQQAKKEIKETVKKASPPPPAAKAGEGAGKTSGITPPPPRLAVKEEAVAVSPAASGLQKDSLVHAGPAVRKLARELGISLWEVKGSKRGGRIAVSDLKKHIKAQLKSSGSAGAPLATSQRALPDFSAFGEVKVEKISNLRKTIAAQMELSARIPQVHQQQLVVINEIITLQKKYGPAFKKAGSSISVTMFVIKALATCLKEFPVFNSSFEAATATLHYKRYYNLGIAVDTPQGLIVPVLRAVDKKSLFEIGKDLVALAKQTRARKLLPEALKGASITLSNLGGIGGSFFTPLINWPEVAILGTGRSQLQPAYAENGELYAQTILPVTLGYDHRVIDGAEAARFIMRLTDLLENPAALLMGFELSEEMPR